MSESGVILKFSSSGGQLGVVLIVRVLDRERRAKSRNRYRHRCINEAGIFSPRGVLKSYALRSFLLTRVRNLSPLPGGGVAYFAARYLHSRFFIL